MEFLTLLILSILILIIKFIINWIKIKIFMYTFKVEGNSFLYTIAYLLGKKELEDFKNFKK